ncbi:hypothetical protein [Paramicrobacterium agarici]|nr:hypothetical protein [Microbacterium agarici]
MIVKYLESLVKSSIVNEEAIERFRAKERHRKLKAMDENTRISDEMGHVD